MPDSSFDVTRFENRNGVISWRVSGWLHGLRVRKNFKSREEAGAEMAALEAKAAQAAGNVRGTSTFLTDDQLREAEASFRRLIGAPKSLSFYLDYALANYRAPEREIALGDAAAAYLASKRQEHTRGLLSACQLKDIRLQLERLKKHFPNKTLSQLSRESLAIHCQRGNARRIGPCPRFAPAPCAPAGSPRHRQSPAGGEPGETNCVVIAKTFFLMGS